MDEMDMETIIDEQHQEIMAAQALDSDIDLAFKLQMQEAISASMAHAPRSSSHPPLNPNPVEILQTGNDFDYYPLLLEDLKKIDQQRRDLETSKSELKKAKKNLYQTLYDQQFAMEIMEMTDDEWMKDGENYNKPYGDVASSSSSSSGPGPSKDNENIRVYFKGLVSEERIKDNRVVVAGVATAICDARDSLIWEMKRSCNEKSSEKVEFEALILALETALSLDLNNITVLCEHNVHRYFIKGEETGNSGMATLVNQAKLLQKKFNHCRMTLVTRNNINFAVKFAREAIISQISWSVVTSKGVNNIKQTCVICFEDIDVSKMFSVEGCYHRYCFSCMRKHIEVKMLHGKLATCPHEGCKFELQIDSCTKFLKPELIEVLKERIKEASIEASEKVYCPHPECSALMTKKEAWDYTNKVYDGREIHGVRKCIKCRHYFCLHCKVPWHYNMTCAEYKSKNSIDESEAVLNSLAAKKKWRQCIKCNHMVSLASGCYHITCRCGYEFCYTCGGQWKNKKATCKCPIWDERNIIARQRR